MIFGFCRGRDGDAFGGIGFDGVAWWLRSAVLAGITEKGPEGTEEAIVVA